MLDLSAQIAKSLSEYTDKVKDVLETTSEEVSKETVKKLKEISPKRTGKYARAWTRKKTLNGYVVYNKRYYLTHLLEKGHAKRGGGRVQGKAHIKPAEVFSVETFEEKVRRKLK